MLMNVGNNHKIYYEIHGINDEEAPTCIVQHGGPGGGLQRSILKLFDLTKWRVILWDQRGCGKSLPYGELKHNTTWYLVQDMERIRIAIGSPKKWFLFGGSWGTTLSLAYASCHGKHVAGMILRGVCLMEPWEQEWLYGANGAARLFPEAWATFASRTSRRQNLTTLYGRRLKSKSTRKAAASKWWGWESAVSTLRPHKDKTPPTKITTLALLENHYFAHNAWLRPGQLIAAARKMRFPVWIVQGRYDVVCPPASAWALSQVLPDLRQLTFTIAGHAATEPETWVGLQHAVEDALMI